MKKGIFILKNLVFILFFSFIYTDQWGLSITAVDELGIGSDHTIQLGHCSDCSDGWKFGEDEYDYPDPFSGEFTNIHFFHWEWMGQQDENGNVCDQFEFSTDFRSIHPNYDLSIWGIRGLTGGGLSLNIPINLSWDPTALDSLSNGYELYLYVGNSAFNMRETSEITVEQEELYLTDGNIPNVKVLLGACASTGTTTHYLDNDNDGWGSSTISHDFCLGYAPEGWAPNSDDLNDNLYCESNLIDGCNVCDGFNQNMDCFGICFGTGEYDECGICGGSGIQQDCGCGTPGAYGIPDGACDCEGNVLDCADVCGGTSTIETLCEDTDGDGLGNIGTETIECVDLSNNWLDGCDLPDLNLYLNNDGSVIYNSSVPLAGFQFDINGGTILESSGGDAEAAGFFVSTNASTIIGFSLAGDLLPPGCGTLLILNLEGDTLGLSNIVVSDNNAIPISFSYYEEIEFDLVLDCSDEYPDCFYNYYDCLGECGGQLEIDECGICGGPGPDYCGGGIYECDPDDCPETINYCLDLHEGANLISFYGLPNDASVTNMLSSIEGIATGVIGEGVAANYNANDGWMGSLSTINPTDGYWVIVNTYASLCIKDAMPTNTPIEYNLNPGPNLISFPAEGSIDLGAGLPDDIEYNISGIIGEGIAANNNNGIWSGSLSNFTGGEGYWVIASSYLSFSYELSSLERKDYSQLIDLQFPNGCKINQSTQQAFYFIDGINSNTADSFDDGWIISYHRGIITGSRRWQGTPIDVPVMGFDYNSYSDGYLQPGDIPNFKYLDNATGNLTDLHHDDIPQWENNTIFRLGAIDANNILPQKIMLSAYPNPFNPTTTINLIVEEKGILNLSIYNISGQLIEELAHEYQFPGTLEYVWDAGNFTSGVYFVQLNISNTSYTQKLVLMK